jgi:UDP-N-acetyl-2-amino-2-deoxyglucuronate dehydrogenase
MAGGTKIRIGIIGAGVIGPTHIQTLREFPDRCEVTAICDVKSELVEDRVKNFNVKGYGDYGKMIAEEKLNAVVLCTPPATHEKLAVDVLKRGVNVLCEKPLAMTAAEGRRIADAADKSGLLFQVAFCHRFEFAVDKIKKAIVSGEFGPVTTFRNVFSNSAGYRPTRGGNLLDNGSHAVDNMRYLLGDPLEVLGAQFRPTPVDDLDKVVDITALFSGPQGAMAYVEAGGRHAGGRFVLEVCGEKTSALFDYGIGAFRWNANGKWQDIDIKGAKSRFHGQANHFLDCLEGKAQCIVDVHEGVRTLELLDKVAKASRDLRANR